MILETEAILGFPIGNYTLWEFLKMARVKKFYDFERVLTVCAAFTGQVLPNPYSEKKTIPWAGWKAYGINTEGK